MPAATELMAVQPEHSNNTDTIQLQVSTQGHSPQIFQMRVLHTGYLEAYMQGLWPSALYRAL